MNRTELERLSREDLIAMCEAKRVDGARSMNRAELIDELVSRQALSERAASSDTLRLARGFFGLARDLLNRVVERGLHLPAPSLRSRGTAPPPAPRTVQSAIPTVTLAEIYANQGHTNRAIGVLEKVLEKEPAHAGALHLLQELRGPDYAPPKPPMPPEPEYVAQAPEGDDDDAPDPTDVATSALADDEHSAPTNRLQAPELETPAPPPKMLDDEPLPPRYDVDECVALAVDPRTLFVYWEVRQRTLEVLRRERGPGVLVLRVVLVHPSWDGPHTEARDFEVCALLGDYYVRDISPDAVVRAAIGYRSADGFLPLSSSPSFAERPAQPGAPHDDDISGYALWTHAGLRPLDGPMREAVERALYAQAHKRSREPLGASATDRASTLANAPSSDTAYQGSSQRSL